MSSTPQKTTPGSCRVSLRVPEPPPGVPAFLPRQVEGAGWPGGVAGVGDTRGHLKGHRPRKSRGEQWGRGGCAGDTGTATCGTWWRLGDTWPRPWVCHRVPERDSRGRPQMALSPPRVWTVRHQPRAARGHPQMALSPARKGTLRHQPRADTGTRGHGDAQAGTARPGWGHKGRGDTQHAQAAPGGPGGRGAATRSEDTPCLLSLCPPSLSPSPLSPLRGPDSP